MVRWLKSQEVSPERTSTPKEPALCRKSVLLCASQGVRHHRRQESGDELILRPPENFVFLASLNCIYTNQIHMKKIFLFLTVALAAACAQEVKQNSVLNVVPFPNEVQMGEGEFNAKGAAVTYDAALDEATVNVIASFAEKLSAISGAEVLYLRFMSFALTSISSTLRGVRKFSEMVRPLTGSWKV